MSEHVEEQKWNNESKQVRNNDDSTCGPQQTMAQEFQITWMIQSLSQCLQTNNSLAVTFVLISHFVVFCFAIIQK